MRIKENLYGPAESSPSFEQLVYQNEKKITNLIYGMTGDYHLAQDLTQETFIKAFQAKDAFNERAKFSTWLYRIAVNVVIDHQRKSCVRQENPAELAETDVKAGSCSDPDHVCEKNALRNILFNAISNLPKQQREVYVLREINGCSTKEVAEILECSVDLVKWRLHKARSLLRKTLQNDIRYKNTGKYTLNSFGLE